jgi:glucokinase
LHFFVVHREQPLAACFGIAGPIRSGSVRTPNLMWIAEGQSLARQLGLRKIALINDLEPNAWGIRAIGPEDLLTLNNGDPNVQGSQSLLSAGTGLETERPADSAIRIGRGLPLESACQSRR